MTSSRTSATTPTTPLAARHATRPFLYPPIMPVSCEKNCGQNGGCPAAYHLSGYCTASQRPDLPRIGLAVPTLSISLLRKGGGTQLIMITFLYYNLVWVSPHPRTVLKNHGYPQKSRDTAPLVVALPPLPSSTSPLVVNRLLPVWDLVATTDSRAVSNLTFPPRAP